MSKGLVKGNKQLVQSLGQLCQQHISDAFKKFNELCSSNLVGMAARAESNRLQTLYLDSQRLLRKRRAAIEAATTAAVMDHFAALELLTAQGDSPQSLTGCKNLSLKLLIRIILSCSVMKILKL